MVQLKSIPPETGLTAYQKILEWFFAYPTDEFTLNDLPKAVGIAKTTTRQTVLRLREERFLTIRELGRLWRISANQQHTYFLTRKIPYNLTLVYESGIVDYIIKNIPSAKVIILFGSYRKGDDVDGSDLDIAVEVPEDQEVKIVEAGTIKQLGYRENVKVNLHIFSRNRVDINVFTNIVNGIVLYGLLEVKP